MILERLAENNPSEAVLWTSGRSSSILTPEIVCGTVTLPCFKLLFSASFWCMVTEKGHNIRQSLDFTTSLPGMIFSQPPASKYGAEQWYGVGWPHFSPRLSKCYSEHNRRQLCPRHFIVVALSSLIGTLWFRTNALARLRHPHGCNRRGLLGT